MSSGNRVSLKYIEEGSYGVTPSDETGATAMDVDHWQAVRYTTESLSGTPSTATSSEVRSDRQVSDQFKVSLEVSGNVSGEFSFGTYDDWLEGALAGSWSAQGTGNLKAGSVLKSYAIEKAYEDVDNGRFVLFNGMRVNTFTLDMKYGEIITASFDFAGNKVTASNATAVLADSGADADSLGQIIDPVTSTTPLNASNNVPENNLHFGAAGINFNSTLNELQLVVNNNLRPQSGIGRDAPIDQILGTSQISGSFEIYLDQQSFELYSNNVLDQDKIKIDFTIQQDSTHKYDFTIPNAKITGSTPAGSGIDTDTVLSGEFNALYDSTLQTALQISRTSA